MSVLMRISLIVGGYIGASEILTRGTVIQDGLSRCTSVLKDLHSGKSVVKLPNPGVQLSVSLGWPDEIISSCRDASLPIPGNEGVFYIGERVGTPGLLCLYMPDSYTTDEFDLIEAAYGALMGVSCGLLPPDARANQEQIDGLCYYLWKCRPIVLAVPTPEFFGRTLVGPAAQFALYFALALRQENPDQL